jgi:thiol-disulfide isomerase/thioredoxin
MNKKLIAIILSFACFYGLQAQYDIKFDIENYKNDTLLVGYYFGDRQLSRDTVLRNDKGAFHYTGKDTLKAGVYMILFKPKHEFVQFLTDGKELKFTMKVDFENLNKVSFNNSKLNEEFYNYLGFLSLKRDEAQQVKDSIEKLKASETDYASETKQLESINNSVKAEQERMVEKDPSSMLALLIRANFETEIPAYEGTEEEIQIARYLFYKNHYFDHIDFNNKGLIRTPFINDRIEYYLEKLSVQLPDSLIKSIDTILAKLEPNEDAYKYYLSNIFNKYVGKKIVGMDAIYVHMVDKYYSPGKATWVTEENLDKMKTNANNFRNILIGNKMPEFTTYKQDGTPVPLSGISSDYTILLFWAPDCGHCKKSMPDIVKFHEGYKTKADLTLMSICTKSGDKEADCWEFINEKHMEGFLNTTDKYQRYRRDIYIPSTPKVFILDKQKEILIKDIPSEELERIMDEIIKSKEKEQG